jgi:HK97 family phage prohead protease
MEHITKAATVTATTDRGDFTAIIAAYTVDRVGDRIAFGAFAKTIAAWRASGKRIPLHWNHRDDPQYIIGSFDPATMEEIEGKGLVAAGSLDLENSEMAREAWRAMKTGSMSLSFGYMVPDGKSKKGRDGITDVFEIDMFEGTIAPAPANADTRILSMKSAEEQREEAKRVEREAEEEQIPDVPEQPEAPAPPEIDLAQELQEVKAQLAEVLAGFEDLKKKQAEVTDKAPRARSVDPLRAQAEAVALEEASGGESLRKPPRKVASKPPDLLPLKELRQRTRDETLLALSGEQNE